MKYTEQCTAAGYTCNGQPSKGPFNNYVDNMRGEGVKKCLFLPMLRVQKLSTQGGGVKKWQNSVHVVVE